MKITDILFCINMFSGMGFSILAPLFPSKGTKDGFSESLIGWIIGIFALSSTCISPFTPLLIKKYSRIKLLFFATFCEATSTLLYGFINFINSFYGILFFMLTVRIIHGCCCGIIGTLVYSLTISLSKPSELYKSLGNLEIAWCIGITTGPIFASFFYKLGGYSLPFFMLGSLLYTSVFLSTRVAKEKTDSDEEIKNNPPFLKYLTYGKINFILLAFFSGYISQSFFYPCLANHLLQNFNLNISISSLFFIIIAISNLIVLQYLEALTKKFGLYETTCIGLLIVSLGVLMIFPYPPLPKNIIIIIFGFILIGGGGVPIFVPGLIALNENIKKIDNNIDNLTVNDITSAINFLTINIGDFCGPIIGGFLSTYLGCKHCCLVISCIIVFYCIFYFFYFIKLIFDKKEKGKEKNYLDEEKKSDENELFNHPGTFKDNKLNDIKLSKQSSEILGRRFSVLLMKDENNELEYNILREKD